MGDYAVLQAIFWIEFSFRLSIVQVFVVYFDALLSAKKNNLKLHIVGPGQQFSYDMWNYLDIQQYVIREAGMV